MIRLLTAVLLFASFSVVADTEVPHTFEDGTPAKASEVNANFDALEAAIDAIPEGPAGPAGAKGDTGADFWTNRARTSGDEFILHAKPLERLLASASVSPSGMASREPTVLIGNNMAIQLFTDGGWRQGIASAGMEAWLWESLDGEPVRNGLFEVGKTLEIKGSWKAELFALELGCKLLHILLTSSELSEAVARLSSACGIQWRVE